jgi:hypothetical protein
MTDPQPQATPSRALREAAGVAAGFAVLTAVLTWPQIAQLTTGIAPHYDALFSVWRLSWVAHQLPRDPFHLFDANIFYPERGVLAYSDAMLLQGLLGAPLIWAGVHPVLVYNLLLMASFVAAGASMYALVRTETESRAAAWIAGAVFAFQGYRFAHYMHLELLWGWPIPLAFLALNWLLQQARLRDGLLLGAAVALQALSCLYYVVYLATALLVLAFVRLAGQRVTRFVKAAAAAVIVVVMVAGAYAIPYVERSGATGMRGEAEIRQWSPTWRNYIAAPGQNWIYGTATGHLGHAEGALFVGVVALGLAAAGLVDWWKRRILAYGVLLFVAVDLSLGFNGVLYRILYPLMLPYHNLRVPARMFVVVSAVIAVLSGAGAARLLSRIASPIVQRMAACAIVVAVLLESATMPIPLVSVPQTPPAAYRWLAMQPPGVVLEWPVPQAWNLGVTNVPLYMYYSTFHWRPLASGYSGVHPLSFIKLTEHVSDLPRPRAVRYLQRLAVRYVILHSPPSPDAYAVLQRQLRENQAFRLLLTDREAGGELTIFELRQADAAQ